MRTLMSLIRREFMAYFLSPIAYVVLVVFLLVTGYLFNLTLNRLTAVGPRGVEYPMQALLGDEKFWLMFLLIPPLLTMRLLAEERGTGTLEMLMTAPIKDRQVVLAKFIACFAFYLVMWLPTLVYVPLLTDMFATWNFDKPSVYAIACMAGLGLTLLTTFVFLPAGVNGWAVTFLLTLGLAGAVGGGYAHYTLDKIHVMRLFPHIDPWPVVTSYIGVILVGAMFLSIGLFVSSLVRSQMVAALVAVMLNMVFIVAGFWKSDADGTRLLDRVINFISVPSHFGNDFTRGIIDTRNVTLYVSVTLLCLFLTVRSLESRRWK